MKDKDINWAEEILNKKLKENNYKDGDEYLLNDEQYEHVSSILEPSNYSIIMISEFMKIEENIEKRLKLAEMLPIIRRKAWDKIYEYLPELQDYHLNIDFRNKRFIILSKKRSKDA